MSGQIIVHPIWTRQDVLEALAAAAQHTPEIGVVK